VSDNPDETARTMRPFDAPRAAILRPPPGEDRGALPRSTLLDASPIGIAPPPPPEIAALRGDNTAPFPRTAASARPTRYRAGRERL